MKEQQVHKLKRFITARSISLGLILLLAVLLYVSTLIPQAIDSAPGKIEEWRRVHLGLLWLVDTFHLHGLYAQPWFASIILFAAVSLGASSYDQWTVARRKRSSFSTAKGEIATSVTYQHLTAIAHNHNYRHLGSPSNEQLKFIRNSWGYFGVLMLHIGMTLVISASLYVSLTGRQGTLILVEGELSNVGQQWDAAEQGLLTSPLHLPGRIRLDKVMVSFDNRNQPIDVQSKVSVTSQPDTVDSFTASINRITRYKGLRIYHASQYGDAFTVAFTDRSGRVQTERILAQQPLSLEKAGYSSDFGVTWSPYQYETKYYADADKKSMLSRNPQLVVRMFNGTTEVSRTSLTTGNAGTLGDYRVQLVKVEKWAKLIFVDISGMSAIFAGFAIIMLGGMIHYMTPPRELIGIKQADGSYHVYWKAIAFKDFYGDERDQIAQDLKRESII